MELESSVVSIDMIDLSINISSFLFDGVVKPFLSTFQYDPSLKYWESFVWNKYKHNWNWETEDYSFFFSYINNIGGDDLGTRFRVSYNPNKVPRNDKMLIGLLNIFKYNDEYITIQSADIAFDYDGISTSDLIFDKGSKKEYKIFKYPDSDFTYYLGKSGSNGSVKVYDKASEETKGQASYNKTRYEVTVRPKIYTIQVDGWKCTTTLPKLFIRGVQGLYVDEGLSPTDKLLLYSVEHGFPMSQLTYRQKIKYDKISSSRKEMYTKIEPSQREIEKALSDFINNLW